MKIACQSCQAKYTIADEKVLGKIVKIRCKKCGATIVINGNETEGATQAFDAGAQQQQGGGVYDYTAGSGGESWTVNVSDGDQRTMTTAEIAEAFRGGVVNDETYCWKDGMGDWLPLRDIPELATALHAGPQPSMHAHQSEAPPPPDDQPTQAGFNSLFGGGGGGGQDAGASLFGGGAAAAAAAPVAAAPSAARRAGGRGAGGADLFGSAATAGSEQDVMTGGGGAAGGEAGGSMTGQRNENSVLFSLSALTANAPKEEAPMPQGEGSGLIDIRALSSNMAQQNNGPAKVDDIMNLGGGGAFSAALAAPVLAPPPADVADLSAAQTGESKKGNTGLIVAMVGGLLVFGLIIAGAIVYVMRPPQTATTTPTATNTGGTTAPTDTATSTAGSPTGSVAVADTAPTSTGAAGTKPTATATGGTRPTSTGATAGTGTAATTATATATSTGGGTGKCGCAASDFNCQMACSAGVKPTATATAATNTASAPFDKGAALSSLSGIASSLGSCKKPDGPTGSGKVTVTFEPSGNVSKVEFIEGPFGGTAVGGCIAGKFRGAHIPPFAGGAVPANKSFVVN